MSCPGQDIENGNSSPTAAQKSSQREEGLVKGAAMIEASISTK